MATLGCGKQITEDKTENARIIQNQELPSSLILNLNTNDGFILDYEIPQNANILMPEGLILNTNNNEYKQVTIKYNYDRQNEQYDFECKYSTSNSTNQLSIKSCQDYFGEVITSITDFEFPIYFQKSIRIELNTPSINLNIKAIYIIDWK